MRKKNIKKPSSLSFLMWVVYHIIRINANEFHQNIKIYADFSYNKILYHA